MAFSARRSSTTAASQGGGTVGNRVVRSPSPLLQTDRGLQRINQRLQPSAKAAGGGTGEQSALAFWSSPGYEQPSAASTILRHHLHP